MLRNEKVAKFINEQRKKMVDESVLTAKELLHILTNAAIGDETEIREVVVKRGEFQRNPDTDRMNLVYNEHVEQVEVPIKASDRLCARDMLVKYHKLFTDKKEIDYNTPVFINVGEWEDEEETQIRIEEVSSQYSDRPVFIDNVPLED